MVDSIVYFKSYMSDVYKKFILTLDLKILKPISMDKASFSLTGYPQGLPSWEINGGKESLKKIDFWEEYDKILQGFIDFYRIFFNHILSKKVREKCKSDIKYANCYSLATSI